MPRADQPAILKQGARVARDRSRTMLTKVHNAPGFIAET